jgi:hypothetical protein
LATVTIVAIVDQEKGEFKKQQIKELEKTMHSPFTNYYGQYLITGT